MLQKLVKSGKRLTPTWFKRPYWFLLDFIRHPPLPVQFLRVDSLRGWVAGIRFQYFTKVERRFRTLESKSDIGQNTISHNVMGLSDLASPRSSLLVRPLSVIEKLNGHSNILSIGPRTEGELLNLVGHGFDRKRIRGVDLISYSPWVDLGDMHDLPYDDNSFDAVILGWALGYSQNQKKATSEVIRVARDGAIVAVGIEYNPLSNEEIVDWLGYLPGNEKRITSVDQILRFFEDHLGHVYFNHEHKPTVKSQVGSIIAIFSITKQGPATSIKEHVVNPNSA
jgi:hypothetical protein